MSKRTMADRGQGGGAGLDNFIFPGDATSPAPFGMSSAGLWDEVEGNGKDSSLKRKHDETLNDELLTMLKDAGLETMAVEVGTVQGGQIAALQDSRDGGMASPVAMTASAIFSPNPRGNALPLDSPLLLKRSLGSPAPPASMTASAIFSPSPLGAGGGGRGGDGRGVGNRGGGGGGGGGAVRGLSHLSESPAAMKGTDLRQAASADADTPPKSKTAYSKKKSRRSPPPLPQPPTAAPKDISPPEPVPPPPPVGRTRRACTNYNADSPADTEVPAKRPKKQESKPNKGLRHFSVKVCRKVEEKGSTSYNEVADELVQELATEGEFGSGKETQYDDKNIRRRVYDALNVLMAIDIISKDKKEIIWKGLPESVARSNLSALGREKNERERSLKKKKDQLAELLVQQIAFRNLARRNRLHTTARETATAEAAAAAADPGRGGGGEADAVEADSEDVAASKIYMPFIVVSSSNDTVIQCEMAENREDVFFNFSHEFQIADDNEILKRLGMHKCRKQDLPVLLARELIPQVPDDVLIRDEVEGSSSSSPSSPASSCGSAT